jgi:hypothetical protein
VTSDLVFFVSHVRVVVRCALPEVARGMRAVWGHCDRPIVPTTQQAVFTVAPDGDGFAIKGPQQRRNGIEARDVLPVLEAELYAAMHGWHRGLLALHAAAIALGSRTWLLLGRSGSGKSSLARMAVKRGMTYFSDEIVLCDGNVLWGVPRAIQFAPLPDGPPPPTWLGSVDASSYRLRVTDEREGCMPLWSPPRIQVAAHPRPLAGARVIALERAERDELVPLSPLELLAAIYEAAYRPPDFDVGRLLNGPGSGGLRWATPDGALSCLEASPGG